MAAPAGALAIDELRHRYAAQPRRYLAPLADALRRQGALEEAVTMLRAQLAEYPHHPTGHVVLGQALFDTGALAESREAFERARALDPGNTVVLRHLGEIASLGGDVGAARRWYERLRVMEPFADDVAAQLDGRGELPPGYDGDDDEAPVAVQAGQEVREAEPSTEYDAAHDALPAPADVAASAGRDQPPTEEVSESFELLEFEPAPTRHGEEGVSSVAALDPVVGLDLPPSAPPAELRDGTADDADQLDGIAGGPFATETMAGLLAAQGHTAQAIAVYERLVAERPDDAGLRARLDALRGGPVEATPAAPPAFAAPVEDGSDDAARAALLADAFADLPARAGEAAVAEPEHPFVDTAAPAVSASVGVDAPAPGAGAASEGADPFAEFSFDRFFPDEPSPAPGAAPGAPAAGPGRGEQRDDADLARFDAWLQQANA